MNHAASTRDVEPRQAGPPPAGPPPAGPSPAGPGAPDPFDRWRWWAIGGSALAMALATALPVGRFVDTMGSPVTWSGATFLACGWFGPLVSGQVCGWYANPTLLLGWLLLALRRPRAAAITFGFAVVLALSSVSLFGVEVPQNEGGVNNLRLQRFGPGFYVWFLAILLPFVAALVGWRTSRRPRDTPPSR